MWTPQNRKRYDRSRLRYPSDLTDEEWAHVVPVIPPAKPGGNKRTVDVREVMNGVMYVLSTGCQWRAMPKDLPPKSTVHNYFINNSNRLALWQPRLACSSKNQRLTLVSGTNKRTSPRPANAHGGSVERYPVEARCSTADR